MIPGVITGMRLAALRDKGAEIARDVSDQGWGLLAAIGCPTGLSCPSTSPGTRCRPAPDGLAGWVRGLNAYLRAGGQCEV
jgi:hypothetical protein